MSEAAIWVGYQPNRLLRLVLAQPLRLLCLVLQFSVLRYESVIHEFDPYFNYRSTIKVGRVLGQG